MVEIGRFWSGYIGYKKSASEEGRKVFGMEGG